MALELLIDFDDIINAARGNEAELSEFTTANQNAVLQFVKDFMTLDADNVYVSDSRFSTGINRQAQLALATHYAVLLNDTPAGTGSLSSQSIDSFSVSYTMAKNNAPYNDWLNMTQFGTRFYEIVRSYEPETRFMVC